MYLFFGIIVNDNSVKFVCPISGTLDVIHM